MKRSLITKAIFITFALFSCAITVCGSFILVNKSKYDIFCRDRSIAQAQDNLWTSPENSNIVLKPGERVQLSKSKNYSIRSAGPKTALSQYYDLPKPMDLAKTLNREENIQYSAHQYEKGFMPIISVQSGLVYGWTFTLSYTWTKNTPNQANEAREQWNKNWTNVTND